MQNRSRWNKLPWYCVTWPREHTGKFWKRKLSKARRRFWKTGHARGLPAIESECNYKTW
jgi:hypothetical protein